ncbi:MAG: hypothetical protein KC777_06365 [Cyanobacteria bacterium HKST-UBA02]|nr:hypothetical protein [Cyanobacteria bacterium HKST-UBA02]
MAFDSNVNNTAQQIQSDTQSLVKSFENFLKTNGRWSPKPGSPDMQACFAMEDLQKQADELKKRGGNLNESQLSQSVLSIQQSLSRVESQLRTVGVDQMVMGQVRAVQSDVRQLRDYARGSSSNFNTNNFGGNNFGGNNFGGPTFGNNRWNNNSTMQLLSSSLIGPGLYSITMMGPNGKETVVSKQGSYMLSDGVHSRRAFGQEESILNQVYAGQTGSQFNNNNNWNRGGRHRHGGGNWGNRNVDQNVNGKGMFYFQNMAAMDVKSVSVHTRGGRDDQVDMQLTARSGQTVSLSGTLDSRRDDRMIVKVTSSQGSPASGEMDVYLNTGDQIQSVSGSGNIGEKPFSVKFDI